MPRQNHTIFYILMVIAMIGWGASWVHAKYLSDHMSINEIIFYRYLFTTVSMVPILVWMKKSFAVTPKVLMVITVAAAILTVYTWLFIEGTHLGTAGLGGAFVTTLIPIVTFALSAILQKRHIRSRDALALTLGAVGVMTILNVWSFSSEQILRIENLYFVVAALLWAVLTIISSRANSLGPMVYSFYLYLITTIIEGLFVVDFQTDMIHMGTIPWLNLISIALLSTTFATSIYFVGGQRIGADKISSFTFLVPFSAIGLSAIFLGEKVTAGMLIGTTMAVAAIYMLNKK